MPVASIRSRPQLLQPEEISVSPVECKFFVKESPCHRQKRKVTFKQVVAVRPIKHVDNMTDEELDDVWYNRDGFENFKRSFVNTVKLISSGRYEGDDENHCARGLEGRTREGAFLRRANKYHGRQAVLFEQKRQRKLGIHDDRLISEAYIVENLRCRLTALEMGIKDQNEVFEELTKMSDFEMEDTDLDDTITDTTEEISSDEELDFSGDDESQTSHGKIIIEDDTK